MIYTSYLYSIDIYNIDNDIAQKIWLGHISILLANFTKLYSSSSGTCGEGVEKQS